MNAETQWIQENLVVMPRTVDELAKVLNWHLKERVEAISDEMIEEEFIVPNYLKDDYVKKSWYQIGYRMGAKWFKQQLLKQ